MDIFNLKIDLGLFVSIIFTLFGIGIILFLHRYPKGRDNIYNAIFLALIFLLGPYIIFSYGNLKQFYKNSIEFYDVIDKRIESDFYNTAFLHAMKMKNPQMKNLFLDYLTGESTSTKVSERSIKFKLQEICNDRLRIGGREMFHYWEIGFGLSNDSIEATNYISKVNWEYFAADNGTRVQEKVLCKNVKIKRIHILDTNNIDQYNDQLMLAMDHKKIIACNNKIISNWIDYDFIEEKDETSLLKSKLFGNIDFVLFDRKMLIICKVNPIDQSLISAIVSFNGEDIEAASEFFDLLYYYSKDELPKVKVE